MESRLPEALSDCLEDGLDGLEDAILVDQDGGRHPVSKPILAVNSEFFLALFSNSREDQLFPITIVKRSSSTAEGLALVLSSMVREEVELKEENVMEVIQTAEYLQVDALNQYCQQVGLVNWVLTFDLSLSGWLLSWTAPTPSASGSLPRSSSWTSSTRRRGATLCRTQ